MAASPVPYRPRNPNQQPFVEKPLPNNLEAERAILGGIILDNKLTAEASRKLKVADFFLPQHRIIFSHMVRLDAAQIAIDTITLMEALEREQALDAAGGVGYLSQLTDGLPRLTNIAHYAKIVLEKSKLRQLIYTASEIQEKALAGADTPEQLLDVIDKTHKDLSQERDENPAVIVGFESLLKRECPPVEYAIEPLLSSRGTGEIFAWRGTGKSFITTQMAIDIATGREMMFGGHEGAGGHWPISRPYRCLYVYGEMDDSEIQERSIALASMSGGNRPTDEQLGTMCKDYQKNWRPKISTDRDRRFIEDRVFTYGYEGLILDNISTLWPTSQENQSDRSAILADWFTDLNQRGVWVIFLHHAGKSGEQRGDSEKEDMLSFVLKLRRPANYKTDEQLRVEVHIEKVRHKSRKPAMLMPFEIQLTKNQYGGPEWITRPAKKAQFAAAFQMFRDGMPTMHAAQEVGVSKATIYRWKKMYDENQNPDFHHSTDL